MNLLRRLVLGDLDLTDYPFSMEFGGDLGSPDNVYDVLVSLLSDGEVSTSKRVGNRTLTFSVLVEGATLAELADNEAALIAECDKARNTLTLDPGDGYAAVSVFDVFRVQARLQYADDLEQANYRRYELTIPAWPYPRGADLVTTPAEATTGVETVVFDGTNTTNWSGSGGTFSVVSGALRFSYTGPGSYAISRTAAVSMVGQSYLAFTWKASAPVEFVGFFGQEVARGDAGGGYTISYVKPFDTSASLPFVGVGWSSPASGATTMEIDKISTWTALPYFGTARQKAMSLTPGGSVRTQGSIHVTHASASLGKTIVYTHPSGTGYLPPLRQWRAASETVTTDSTLLSGAYNRIGPTESQFRVPVSALPEGRVELWAWLRATGVAGSASIKWSVGSYMGGVLLENNLQTYTSGFFVLNTWYLIPLGAATMPPMRIGPAGYVQVTIQEFPVVRGVEVDEAYLFATDQGRLTVVDCGTGTPSAGGPSKHLWVDAPSLDVPAGAIYRGTADDRSDAFHAQGYSDTWGVHDFDPTGTNVFVATKNTTNADTSLTHYRRYHTHGGSS